MAKGIVTEGNKQFELAIVRYEQKYEKEIKRIIAETAEIIASEAKANAPVDTGTLRDSIQVDYDDDGLTAVITVGVGYGAYVNYGTGVFAEGPGGSSAKKIPWVYFDEKLGRWVMTHGIKATHFFDQAYEKGVNHFNRAIRKLG